MKRKIIWDNLAKEDLKKSLHYIKQDSPQNAENIKTGIKSAIEEIPAHPERYPADKYRLNNNGDFRAFELYNFRISYFIGNNEIRIVRIRHTKLKTLDY